MEQKPSRRVARRPQTRKPKARRRVGTRPALSRGPTGLPPSFASEERAAETRDQGPAHPFIIVGIGASSGGFDAFRELLDHLPDNTGMAFVVVQHLDREHESVLADLLGRSARLPVHEIRQDTLPAPNQVFVIPPNHNLVLQRGKLRLVPRPEGGINFPVDEFFKSLAEVQGGKAIAVILSGNGTDGTLGMEAIKAEGGITFAQDERSARSFSMPGSAIDAGVVDYILAPARIAHELAHLSTSTVLSPAASVPDESGPEFNQAMTEVFTLVRALSGVDFSLYKQSTIKRRLMRRVVLNRFESLRAYVVFLRQHPEEVSALHQDFLINVTEFFRDPEVFGALRQKVFPDLLRTTGAGGLIRVWVPGCSTGQEVYSLAIAIHEYITAESLKSSVQIFGTDISEASLAKARAGYFPFSIETQVSAERLERYFLKSDRGYRIGKLIRDCCIFARQNMTQDPPFPKLDLISCRNVLIYLGASLQKEVFPIFHYALNPRGYLLLGRSETLGPVSDLFHPVDQHNKIYSKNPAASGPERGLFASPSAVKISKDPLPRQAFPVLHTAVDLDKEVDAILLAHHTPSGVVVNARLEVLRFRGRTGRYFEHAHGEASFNILKMVRQGLVMETRKALTQAMKSDHSVRKEVLTNEDGEIEVAIEMHPFRPKNLGERFFLVLFKEHRVHKEARAKLKLGKHRPLADVERENQRLSGELEATRASLQAIIEEQEGTNEELKCANEEIQSSNEELNSINEELQTAKEELQSTNEELTSINEELHKRNQALTQSNAEQGKFMKAGGC